MRHQLFAVAAALASFATTNAQVTYTSFGSATSLIGSQFYVFASTDTVDSKLGWRFSPTVTGGVTRLEAVIKYQSQTPLNVTFEIFSDTAGVPDVLLGAMTRTITQTPQVGFNYLSTVFTSDGSIPLVAGQNYYAVLSRDALARIDWLGQSDAADGVQVTRGSFNFVNPPGTWELSSTLPNAHFPLSSFRITVPTPAGATALGAGALAIAVRRRRPLSS